MQNRMANFIERTLEPGEKVIFKGRLHWAYNVHYTVLGALLIVAAAVGEIYTASADGDNTMTWVCVGAAVVGLLMIGYGSFMRSRTEFAITPSRFIQKDGIFNIKMTEIPLFKIETVNFYQSLGERIVGTGSIELVGSGGTSHKVPYVEQPYVVRNHIATLMKAAKPQEA